MVNRHEINVVVFQIKGRFGGDTVVSIVVNCTNHHPCGQFTQKQAFFGDGSIPSRHSKTFDFHALEWIFCSTTLQGFDMASCMAGLGFTLRTNKVTSFKDTLFFAWFAFPFKQKDRWNESNANAFQLHSTNNDFERTNQDAISPSYQFLCYLQPKLFVWCNLGW